VLNDRTRIFDGDLTEKPDRSAQAERSLRRTIKDFDGVDGEDLCAGPGISTRRVVDPALSA